MLVRKETIELAFVVAVQLLPPKQRAALILCDVLDWSANETAALLESSVASVNAALQRARAALRERQPERDTHRVEGSSEQKRLLLQQYVDATERCDAEALARLLREDARFSMPPEPFVCIGSERVVQSWVEGGFGSPPFDDWKHVVTSANRMPAVAWYLRRPGDDRHHLFAMDVLRIEMARSPRSPRSIRRICATPSVFRKRSRDRVARGPRAKGWQAGMARAGRDRPAVPAVFHGPDRAAPRGPGAHPRPRAEQRAAPVDHRYLRIPGRRLADHGRHVRRSHWPAPHPVDRRRRVRRSRRCWPRSRPAPEC